MQVRWHYVLILGLSVIVAVWVLIFWPEPSPPHTLPSPSELVIPWDEAASHVGEIKVVEGPIVDGTFESSSMGKPTLLRIGRPYPDSDRFSVLIWGDHRDKFLRKFPPNPETHLLNKTVGVRGFIDDDKGYPEIILTDPADIWVIE